MWSSSVFTKATKVRFFNSLVKPVVMHSCKTWRRLKAIKRSLMFS